VHFAGLRDDLCRSRNITKPPAGDGIGLRQRTASDRPFPRAWQRGKGNVRVRCVDDVLVDLVGDDEGVVFAREVEDEKQLFAGKNFAAWIGGIAKDEGFRFLREGAP